jgi:outer membrane cobalamin receptor
VVEKAGNTSTDPLDYSGQVTVVDLADVPADYTVAEALDSVAGIEVQRLGGIGDWSGISVRGSTIRQVAVFLDGIPMNSDGASAINLSELPVTALSKIEVWRGNAPARFDAAPMGGVVNIITKRGARGKSGVMTVGDYRTGALSLMALGRKEILGREVEHLFVADGFQTAGDFLFYDNNATEFVLSDDTMTKRENNDKRQLNLLARLRTKKMTLTDSVLLRDAGVPGPGVAQALAARSAVGRNLFGLGLSRTDGAWDQTFSLWDHLRVETYDDRNGEVGVGNDWDRDRFHTLGGIWNHKMSVDSRWMLGATLGARLDQWRHTDLATGEQGDQRSRLAATVTPYGYSYLFEDLVTVDAALRLQLDQNGTFGTDETTDLGDTSLDQRSILPRGGVLVRPADWFTVKSSIGQYQRPPDFTELFGDRGSVIGNEDLRPEHGWLVDVGVRAESARGSLEVGFFRRDTTDLITYVQNSQRTMVPVNLGKSQVQGLELAVAGSVGPLKSATSLTRNWSENLSSDEAYAGNQIPGLPAWSASQESTLAFGERFDVHHTWSHIDGNYWDQTNWYRAAPRSLHSAFLRTRMWQSLALELSVRNVFDRRVEEVPRNPLDSDDTDVIMQGIEDFHGYPLPGRTIQLSLTWSQTAEDAPE